MEVDYRKLLLEDEAFQKYFITVFLNATPDIQNYLKFLHSNYLNEIPPKALINIIKRMESNG